MNFLTVTHVRKVERFLQIVGHQKPQLLEQLQDQIDSYLPQWKKPTANVTLHPNFDTIYLAQETRITNKFFRCFVRELRPNGHVLVEFIDYGTEFEMPIENLLELDPKIAKTNFLINFPPIASKYILANFWCEWKRNEFDIIQSLIYKTVIPISSEQTFGLFRLISLTYENIDLTTKLIRANIGVEISLSDQKAELHEMDERSIMDRLSSIKIGQMKHTSRNLLPTRPLQLSNNYNNTIANKGIQLIHSHLAPNGQQQQQKQQQRINNTNNRSDSIDGASNSNYVAAANDCQRTTGNATLPVFIANDLPTGPFHLVYCSYVHDGPNLFSVRLKSQEHILDRMMTDLGNFPLRNLTVRPTIGMACIARYSEDLCFYRVAIQSILANKCRVTYVDYGNSEDVAYADIFEIPDRFLQYKTFSIQCTMLGCKQLEPMDDRIKEYFANLVKDAELELKVVPSDGPLFVQYCELFYKNTTILNMLREKNVELNSYANPKHLSDEDMVIIRYAPTAKKFFVQRIIDRLKYEAMMDRLLVHCRQVPQFNCLPIAGQCCAAMLGNDANEWYRVTVINQIDTDRVCVKFVDFGSIAECRLHQLKPISAEFLKLPRQVTECCLIDFEKFTDVSETTGKQLEMIAEGSNEERRVFRVSLHGRLPDSIYIVNLHDDTETPPLNVSSSLYKHSMPRRTYGNKQSKDKIPITNDDLNAMVVSDTNATEQVPQIVTEAVPKYLQSQGNAQPQANKCNWNTNGRINDGYDNRKTSASGESEGSLRNSDGTEIIERIQDTTQRDRFTNRNTYDRTQLDGDRVERNKPTKNWNGQGNTSWQSNEQAKAGYNNRQTEWDNKRSNDFGHKKPILQKHIIPRFNKRFNQSAYGKPSIGTDQNTNHWESTVYTSSDLQSTDTSSKTVDKSSVPERSFVKIQSEELVGFNAQLPDPLIPLGATSQVNIVMWISPHEFYVQLKSHENDCDEMMKQIQLFYQKRSPTKAVPPIGGWAIVRQKSDNVLKRAKILDHNATLGKYRVQFIDYGNRAICQLTEIYEPDKSFARLPPLAIWCGLQNVILNKSREEIQEATYSYIVEQRKIVQAEFLAIANGKTTIELTIDGSNLKESMIRSGLLVTLPKDVNVQLLTEQTIMIYTTAIKDLACFQAKIYGCDTAFMCSYKDLKIIKQKPKLSSEFRSFEKKYIAVKVNGVSTDNVLMLTMYLPFLDITVDPIENPCFPIYKNEFVCAVSHVESLNEVYIQSKEHFDRLAVLLDDLFAFYGTGGIPCNDPRPLTICAAMSSDGNYYRGKIEQLNADGTVLVRWIDYGNCETIPKSSIKQLDAKFNEPISALAKKIFLPMKAAVDDVATVIAEFLKLAEGYELDVKVIDCYRSHYICDLKSEDFSLIDVLREKSWVENLRTNETQANIDSIIDKEIRGKLIVPEPSKPVKVAEMQVQVQPMPKVQESMPQVRQPEPQVQQPVPQVKQQKQPDEIMETQPMEVQITEKVEIAVVNEPIETISRHISGDNVAYISHADYPNRFFLQLESDTDALETFKNTLQIVAPSLPALTEFRVGVKCIAQYSTDEQWYRAKIIDTDGEITSIQFLDYGNTDSITNNALLKSSNETFDAVKQYAMACALPIEPLGSSEWSDVACNKLRTIIEQPLKFEFICQNGNVNYVKLFVDDRDIAKELISDGLAEPLEITKTGEQCFVSHINSLSDFFIQVDSDSNILRLIEDYLVDVSKFEVLTQYSKGSVCIAQFEDGQYYRAQILNEGKSADGVEVVFLDYGNTCHVQDVRTLPAEIAALPHLRKRCTLKLPEDVQQWSEEAENKFEEISSMGATAFIAQLVKPGKRAIIELFVDNRNVGNELSALCEKKQPAPIVVDENESIVVNKTLAAERSVNLDGIQHIKQRCIVSHINSPFDFFIQLEAKISDLDVMCANLVGASTFEQLKAEQIKTGSVCAVLFSDDESYYRARVLEILENGYKVLFIDFGNESVSNDLRQLPSTLKTMGPLAINCKLDSDVNRWTEIEMQRFTDLICENSTAQEIEIVNSATRPITVTLYLNQQNVCEGIPLKDNSIEPILVDDTPAIERSVNLDESKHVKQQCIVSHINSPFDFFIQLEAKLNDLDVIGGQLENASTFEHLSAEQIKPGDACAALFPDDQCFYRAKVLNIVENGFRVLFIDFGNESVSCDLRQLPSTLRASEPFAINCKLDSDVSKWTETEMQRFTDLINENSTVLEIEIVNSTIRPVTVALYLKQQNICEQILLKRASTETELGNKTPSTENPTNSIKIEQPPLKHRCFLSYVKPPFEFFVQLEENSTKLNVMAARLDAAPTFDRIKAEEIKVGDICAALFADDGAFYRAKVLGIVNNSYKVLFIDFGNECITADLRQLPSKLVLIEPMALHCKLDAVISEWTEIEIKRLSDILKAINNSTFQEIEIIDGATAPKTVKLYLNHKNICEQIKGNSDRMQDRICSAVLDEAISKAQQDDAIAGRALSDIIEEACLE